jgi:hypothetical protein
VPADQAGRWLPSRRSWSRGCRHRSRLALVEDEFTLGEVPAPVDPGEGVEVAEGGDHKIARAVFAVDVVSDRVALARGAVPIDGDRALASEVRRNLVAIEVLEDRCKRFPSLWKTYVGSLPPPSIKTAKTVSSVKSPVCPSASRRSAQCAYASKSSCNASRSAASADVSSVWMAIAGSSSESDEVDVRNAD